MSEFSKSMEEAGEKAEETGASMMTRVSLAISVLAVCVAMVTVLSHREHTAAVLMQARADDQWNEYQAHKIRMQALIGEDEVLTSLPTSDRAADIQKMLAKHAETQAKWTAASDGEADKAKEYSEAVERAEGRAGRFDLAEALLEISVVLASITLLTKHGRYVAVGVLLGLSGAAIAASAYWVK